VTLFNYGHFNAYDSRMAEASLMAYAVGLTGFTLVKVFSPGFYARQDSRSPVKIGVISVVANIFLNLVITIPWAMSGLAAPHAGLALSTSLAAFVNAWLLYRGLRRSQVYQPAAGWRPFVAAGVDCQCGYGVAALGAGAPVARVAGTRSVATGAVARHLDCRGHGGVFSGAVPWRFPPAAFAPRAGDLIAALLIYNRGTWSWN